MTQTTDTLDRARIEAQADAVNYAGARFVLEPFETPDGENADPVTGAVPVITMWGVFDTERRDDGRGGMVWLPKALSTTQAGFQAARDEIAALGLLSDVRSEFVAEAMRVWDAAHEQPPQPVHTVIRLDQLTTDADPANRPDRLRQLAAMYDQAKRAADEAAAALKEITDGIKAEVRRLHPESEDFTITSGALAHPLTLQRVVSRRFDTAGAKRVLTAEQYDSLCKDSEAWVLRAKKG